MTPTSNASQQAPARRLRSSSWPDFQSRLSETLDRLSEDQFLIIQQKKGPRYIQFAGQGSFGLRVEVVSNHFLTDDDRFKPEEHDALIRLGWHAPSGDPATATPDLDPDGSPNYHVDFPAGASTSMIADLAVSTLIKGLSIAHPGMLQYEAFDSDGNALYLPTLKLKSATDSISHLALPDQLLRAVRTATGLGDIEYDAEGDLTLQYGGVAIFLTIAGTPAGVRLCSPLVTKIKGDAHLLARINALNSEMMHMHCAFNDDAVYALSSMPAAVLMTDDFGGHLNQFSAKAEEIAIELRALSGGSYLAPASVSSSALQ